MKERELIYDLTTPMLPDDFDALGLTDEAHTDDMFMGRVTNVLSKHRTKMRVLTHSNGDARDINGYTPEELAQQRLKEGKVSHRIVGVYDSYNAQLPDGQLSNYENEGKAVLHDLVVFEKPDFIIVPHPLDPHPDHASVARQAREIAVFHRIPLYYMNTISGRGSDGSLIIPTHRFKLTRGESRREKRGYRANITQTTNLPKAEIRDVYTVLGMTGTNNVTSLIHDTDVMRSDPIGSKLRHRRVA